MAQEKIFALEDLIPGGKTFSRFLPKLPKQLCWIGNAYLYVRGDSAWVAYPEKSEQIAFTLEQLNEALTNDGVRTLSSLPDFTPVSETSEELQFVSRQHRLHYDYKTNRITRNYRLKSDWMNQKYSSGNGYIAFTEGNNIRILSPENELTIVTDDETEGVVYGHSVHQNEFGIKEGLFWSPSGRYLAFYRMDERMVTAYPLVDVNARIAESKPHKYPMAGMKSHEVTVGVYDLEMKDVVYLKTGLPKEKYLTNIAWSPDEKGLYIAELNRDQNEMALVRYAVPTGERETVLFTEQSERYVEPQNPVLFLPDDPSRFIWQSDRDGFNHLYLYDTSGKLLKQLTKGEWVVQHVLGFDQKGKHLFFSGTAPHPLSSFSWGTPLEQYGWRLHLKSGEKNCITRDPGVHTLSISPNGEYAIDRYSTPTEYANIKLIKTKTAEEVSLIASAKNPYKNHIMPEITSGMIKADDGETDLFYRLLKPVGLDEKKKYPTIVYVYGGPHNQMVTGGFLYGTRGWEIYMAQRGYVVFVLDNRGSSNRGRAFEQVIYRHLGTHEMADQMKGVEFLKSLPFVDGDRIGVHGWSYGGFMTTNLMLTYPDVFKVGVAGGPVIDWKYYEIMYGERYMDRPQDNPDGYAESDLKQKAGNLKGRLLLIHGDVDPVVVWQHSLRFLKACVDAGTYPDYFVYPGHSHNVIGKDRVHLHEKITRYFDDNL